MSNTKMKWEANPQGVRKIVMELVAELDPALLSSPAVEKCIHDITSYANEVANKAVAEFAKNLKSIEYPPSGKEYHFEDGSWTNIESLYPYLDQLRTKTGEGKTYNDVTVKKYDLGDLIE